MKTELLALIENYGKALVHQTEGKISAFKDAKNLMSNIVFLLDKAEQAQAPVAKCEACNDNGLIGGPSFYDPGEGGVPCPDCSAPAAVEPVEIDYPHEQMDALALARYKVLPSDQSMYWRHAVVAGEGLQHLYNGSEVDCQIMARKFAGAFLDGAFTFHQRYTAPRAQPSDALDAEIALRKVLSAVQLYLPPDGISIDVAMNEVIAAVDPWPIGRVKDES